MARKYILREEKYDCGATNRKTYGVAAIEICDDIMMVIESIADISTNKADVENLVCKLNKIDLEPLFLENAIHDFLLSQ